MVEKKRILITGGAGFIGHHIVEHFRVNRPDWELFILDRLSYAGSLERLTQWHTDDHVHFIFHDFRAELPDSLLQRLGTIDVIVHSGAETHVDRSLTNPGEFVTSNVIGTFNMLQAARRLDARIILVSTDEVYGPALNGVDHKEGDPFSPSNPYSATKAGSESLAFAWAKSFGVKVTISNTMNNFGERQHPEKFIPMTLALCLAGKEVNIHASPDGVPGSRKWLHARNHADALMFIIDWGLEGKYHIAGIEKSNLEIARLISEYGKTTLNYRFVDFHSSRLGHDLRYSLDDSKIRALGWTPPVGFYDSLRRTIEWTLRPENLKWLKG